MVWPAPTLADVLKARLALAPYLLPTPALQPPALGVALGCRAVLKCENLNPTGAFKVRGGINLLAVMEPEARTRGVVAASTGNHGQSVAYAARVFGSPATIFMPREANSLKVAATVSLGANVIQTGRDFDQARLAAEEHAALHNLRYIHSSNEPLLVAGVATAALELLELAPDLDAIIVPVGGGSGVLGAGVVARAVNPAIRIVGVQAAGAPAVYHSWREGRRIVTETVETFADGLATREPFEMPLALLPYLVDEIVLVSDEEIAAAIRLLFETTRQVAEGAGAAAVAVVMTRRDEFAGKRVGLMLSGGNITTEQFRRILSCGPLT
ncbi:MAG: threonine/serine dehydratase [Isosphaeraceae bacterium]